LVTETTSNATHELRTLKITDQDHGAWVCGLDTSSPDVGTGALRIRAGPKYNSDLVAVVVSPKSPLMIEHQMPKRHPSGDPAQGSYSFTITFSTAAFNGLTGDVRPYTAPAKDLQMDTKDEANLIDYAKRTLRQEHAPRPIEHGLRSFWSHLPANYRLLAPRGRRDKS